jgi:hypothetical protein
VPLSAASGPEWSTREGGAPAPQVKTEFKNSLISLEVRDAGIGEALEAVAEKTGIGLAEAIYGLQVLSGLRK